MDDLYIRKVQYNESDLITEFLEIAGSSLKSFRYFEKRTTNIIINHLTTCLLMKNSKAVGYGHLDIENKTVWLGIAVIESATGKGYGKRIMTYLINSAHEKRISVISLTVDKNNQAAINLYTNFNFQVIREIKENTLLMKKIMNYVE